MFISKIHFKFAPNFKDKHKYMLVQFTFSNYKCFKDETVLNLTTTKTKSKEFYSYTTPFGYRVLKTLAVYGANASGKSKLFDAFKFLKHVLMARKDDEGNLSWQKEYDSFRLNTSMQNVNSEFETVFILNGIQYRYALELNREKIVSEYLYRKDKKEVYVFERTSEGIKYNKTYVKKAKMLIDEDMIRDEVPLLSALYDWNDALATEIINWFKGILVISSNDLQPSGKEIEDDGVKKVILKFLQQFDINIEDINRHEIPVDNLPRKIKLILSEKLLKSGKIYKQGVTTAHKLYDEHYRVIGKTLFQMENDESFGTNRLFFLSFPLLSAIHSSSVIFIDEFDSGIHPNILRELISMFYSLEGEGTAQLIINTQNSSLLKREIDVQYQNNNEDFYRMENRKLFIKDQIYFVSKNQYGESSLVPLTNYKDVRSNWEELYLNGYLDGVPIIDSELITIKSKEDVF